MLAVVQVILVAVVDSFFRVRSDSSSQFLVWRIIMIKTIETDIGTYYFDSVNFTLSLSPISKQSSPTLDSVEDGVLKK